MPRITVDILEPGTDVFVIGGGGEISPARIEEAYTRATGEEGRLTLLYKLDRPIPWFYPPNRDQGPVHESWVFESREDAMKARDLVRDPAHA